MTLKEPGDVIAMIPYLLGFTPADSLVVLALQGPRKHIGPCLRVDLARTTDEGAAQAEYLVSVVAAHRFAPVLLVALTTDVARADAVVRPLRRGLARRRIKVSDALRADGHRWWSYTCHDPTCCSPEGKPYDADSSRVAAEAVLAGLTRAPDRDSLRAELESCSDEARRALATQCRSRAQAYATGEQPRPRLADVDRLLLRHRGSPASMSVGDAATLLLGVQDQALRAAAMALMTRSNAAGYLGVWRHVMRDAPDDLLAPVGALTGFAAWLDGQGTLASHAVDRVQSVSAGDAMCALLRRLLDGAVSPDQWNGGAVHPGPAS
jgi:uncharacterized protein DUF4192